mgnify:CR=1 FL=1
MINQPSVEYLQIGENEDNQRIDNFLIKHFRTIPKSHLYQILRSGQVRVNGKRISAKYRLQLGETLRIPPLKIESGNLTAQKKVPPSSLFQFNRLYEDDAMLVIDKPSGMAVHGGSGISFGVIEQLRAQHSSWEFLELVHRLDRETSGVLMLAKKRSALVELHKQIREGSTEKHYLVMVKGEWKNTKQHVRLALNEQESGTFLLELRNTIGEVVYHDELNFIDHLVAADLRLDGALGAGVYFVVIKQDGKFYRDQFVISR